MRRVIKGHCVTVSVQTIDVSSSRCDGAGVTLTVADVLALPVLARARPEVLCGAELDRRAVRWVHTSEIYEIGPLLKGGEILLTTGLGLTGCGEAALDHYAADLAGRGVAALVLELGRTFPAPPAALVAAACRHGLPFVVLHGVVPFVDVTEAVHQVLLTGELEQLRQTERVHSVLTDGLLSGVGLEGLLVRVAGLAGCRAALVATDGHVVAVSDGARDAWRPHRPRRARRAVEVYGLEWGHLELGGAANPIRTLVLDGAVVAVALELARSGDAAPARREAGGSLVRDLATARFRSAEEVAQRAALVGFGLAAAQGAVGVAVRVDPATPMRSALAAARDAARRTFRASPAADLDDDVLLAVAAPDDEDWLRERLRLFVQRVDVELGHTSGGRVLAVAAGPVVPDTPALARSLPPAREAVALASRLGTGSRVLLSTDLAVPRLVARLLDDPELERFVDSQLGRLLEHDAASGGQLLVTLEAYLANGLAKTATAQVLGVRRQTLYNRLARIETLLGGRSLDDHDRRTALELALVAYRLRFAAATR
jgi:purine catabolism regulator